MADAQAVLGAVALIIVAIALILALTMLVLIEARWTLGLWGSLHRSWKSTIRQVQDTDSIHNRPAEPRGDG
jgi:hypothetical protein